MELTVTAAGKSLSDLLDALDEVRDQVAQGFTSSEYSADGTSLQYNISGEAVAGKAATRLRVDYALLNGDTYKVYVPLSSDVTPARLQNINGKSEEIRIEIHDSPSSFKSVYVVYEDAPCFAETERELVGEWLELDKAVVAAFGLLSHIRENFPNIQARIAGIVNSAGYARVNEYLLTHCGVLKIIGVMDAER